MKKLFIISIASMFAITQTNAQVTFGVKGGFSLASLNAKGRNEVTDKEAKEFNGSDKKMLPAFHGGVTADIPLTEKLVLQPALQFAKKGVKFEKQLLDLNTKTRIVVNYLELPVNLVYRQSSKGGFYVGAGPYVGYALNGKTFLQTKDNVGNEEEDDEKLNFKDDVKRFDAGANLMIGYELPSGFTIGANYNLGLANIHQDREDIRLRNRYFGVSIGYKFK